MVSKERHSQSLKSGDGGSGCFSGGSTVSISGGDSYCNGGGSSGDGDSSMVLMMVAVPAVSVEACYWYWWCYWW